MVRNSIVLLKGGESSDDPWEDKTCTFCRVKLCFGHDSVVPGRSSCRAWCDEEAEEQNGTLEAHSESQPARACTGLFSERGRVSGLGVQAEDHEARRCDQRGQVHDLRISQDEAKLAFIRAFLVLNQIGGRLKSVEEGVDHRAGHLAIYKGYLDPEPLLKQFLPLSKGACVATRYINPVLAEVYHEVDCDNQEDRPFVAYHFFKPKSPLG